MIYGVIFEGSNRSILVSNTKAFSASGQPKSVYMSTTFEVNVFRTTIKRSFGGQLLKSCFFRFQDSDYSISPLIYIFLRLSKPESTAHESTEYCSPKNTTLQTDNDTDKLENYTLYYRL